MKTNQLVIVRLFAAIALTVPALGAQAAGCTPVKLTAPVDPQNICYGNVEWNEPTLGDKLLKQTFNLYRPASAGSNKTPLIIYAHPNGMSKALPVTGAMYKALVPPALNAGYAFASLEFRHPVVNEEPGSPAPVPHTDIARAIQFIRANADALGVDTRNIFVAGQSRGTLALWTVLQNDMADPNSTDPVSRQSTRANAAWMVNAQTSYDGHEFSELFLVPRDRPLFNAAFDREHPKHAQFGSAIKSVNAGAQADPPVVLRYDSKVVAKLLTIEEMQGQDAMHYPNFGPALCNAYQLAFGNTTRCTYQADPIFQNNPELAFKGYVGFFQKHRVQ
jgi:acetyl esterase/lipase